MSNFSLFILRKSPKLIKNYINFSKGIVKPLQNAKSELTISEKCVERLNKLAKVSNEFLRVSVEGGGCSGFQYKFELDSQINEDDK